MNFVGFPFLTFRRVWLWKVGEIVEFRTCRNLTVPCIKRLFCQQFFVGVLLQYLSKAWADPRLRLTRHYRRSKAWQTAETVLPFSINATVLCRLSESASLPRRKIKDQTPHSLSFLALIGMFLPMWHRKTNTIFGHFWHPEHPYLEQWPCAAVYSLEIWWRVPILHMSSQTKEESKRKTIS